MSINTTIFQLSHLFVRSHLFLTGSQPRILLVSIGQLAPFPSRNKELVRLGWCLLFFRKRMTWRRVLCRTSSTFMAGSKALVVARSFLAFFGLLRSLVDLFFGESPALQHSSTIHAGQHWLVLLAVHVVLVRVGNRNTISTSPPMHEFPHARRPGPPDSSPHTPSRGQSVDRT
jgi:hypothetical protein